LTAPGDDPARLEARNAAMKEQVNSLLDQFHRQTEQLRNAQEAAAQTSATVTSKDGLVRATIDSTGSLSQLQFAPKAFQRSNPEALANTVLDVVRQGSLQVKQQIAALMSPLTEGLPDLADLIQDAPSLKGLVPKIPDFTPEPESRSVHQESLDDPDTGSIMRTTRYAPAPPPRAVRGPARPEPVEDDDPPASWLTGGDR
jgi:DNA-binding protein YbaB